MKVKWVPIDIAKFYVLNDMGLPVKRILGKAPDFKNQGMAPAWLAELLRHASCGLIRTMLNRMEPQDGRFLAERLKDAGEPETADALLTVLDCAEPNDRPEIMRKFMRGEIWHEFD